GGQNEERIVKAGFAGHLRRRSLGGGGPRDRTQQQQRHVAGAEGRTALHQRVSSPFDALEDPRPAEPREPELEAETPTYAVADRAALREALARKCDRALDGSSPRVGHRRRQLPLVGAHGRLHLARHVQTARAPVAPEILT